MPTRGYSSFYKSLLEVYERVPARFNQKGCRVGSPQTETTLAGFPTCHDGDRCSSELSVAKIKLEYPNTWPFFLLKNLAHPKCRRKINLKVFLDVFGLSKFKSELCFVQKKFVVEISNLMTLIVRNCSSANYGPNHMVFFALCTP